MAFTVQTRTVSGASAEHSADAPLEALRLALAEEPDEECYVSWEGTEALCAVDLDVDEVYRLDGMSLLVLLESFHPVPSVAWTTHGGGLRLTYVAQDPFSADEVAAVAALNLANRPYTGLELKHDTRHPLGPDSRGRRCTPPLWRQQSFDRRSLRRHLGVFEACDAEVEGWLGDRGMAVGGRYEHTQCPVSPSDRGGRSPVCVNEQGIHCFVCEAAGTCAGSSRPGFFPFSHFCGQRRATHLYRCLESATHWEHARFVLEHSVDLPSRLSRLVYSAGVAMLRCRADADRAFAVGRDLVRIGDRWTNLSGEAYAKDLRPLLASLPVCSFTVDGKVRVDRGRVVLFEQSFDLSRYGYPSLNPVFGCRLWPEDDPEQGLVAVVQTRELAGDDRSELRPRTDLGFRVGCGPMQCADAWVELERVFPGLNRELLMLLVAARGIAEGASSMPPMVFVTGPTGAGKTITSFLAASVCGDRNTEVVWSANTDRMRQSVADAATNGTFVTFNEVLKEARSQLRNGSGPMDYVLNLTPDSVSHRMYVGPSRLGRLPVLVWTDTELPQEIRTDAQLARRVVHVHLPGGVDWEPAWRRAGLRHPQHFRTSSNLWAETANAILRCTVERFLRPPKDFGTIARELGFGRISESDEAEEGRDRLLALFDAVCAAPALTGSDAQRWKGAGWRLVNRDVSTPLRDAWLEVADECFVSSRAASEVDWQGVAKLREAARIEVRAHGTRVAIRFRSVLGTRIDYRTNGELR